MMDTESEESHLLHTNRQRPRGGGTCGVGRARCVAAAGVGSALLVFSVTLIAVYAGGGDGGGEVATYSNNIESAVRSSAARAGGVPAVSGVYRTAAVATDAAPCSTVGRAILEEGGSSVDAAIAACLCVGLHNVQSNGIGGGFFMTIYDTPRGSSQKELVTLDAREVAPLAATRDMFTDGTSSAIGGKSIAVPSEIAGYYKAWQRFGKLPWARLFEPSINMSRKGVVISQELQKNILNHADSFAKDPNLRSVFLHADGSPRLAGELLHRPLLTRTLETLAQGSAADDFYRGSLARDVVADIQECDGIITEEDLVQYKPLWKDAVLTNMPKSKLKVASSPLPSGGGVLQYILLIMDGYGYDKLPVSAEGRVLMYHRLIEAFKFAAAMRTRLGDSDYLDCDDEVRNMTSATFAAYIRSKISDDRTHDLWYYGPLYANRQSHGTTSLSVVGADGSAVTITSTINIEFGSSCMGSRTGILFNDEMDDFASPHDKNQWDLEPSEANFIAPGKRPLSSMAPTLVFDADSSHVIAAIGGAGGSKITPAVAYTAFHNLWLGQPLREALSTPRLHHQLQPADVMYEAGLPQEIIAGLLARGHSMREVSELAVVQGVYTTCHEHAAGKPCVEAVSDGRKLGGAPAGY